MRTGAKGETPKVSIKAVDSLTPADLWREVPLEQEVREQVRDRQRPLLAALLEEALEEEQLELLAAGRYRRVESRRGYAMVSMSETWQRRSASSQPSGCHRCDRVGLTTTAVRPGWTDSFGTCS
jgi:hypothetical protein